MQAVELGDKVKDVVTGFTGVAVARTTWLHGCDRIVLQPEMGKDGKVPENASFDAPQIVVVKKSVAASTPVTAPARARGGPRDDKAATRRKD